MLKLDMQGIQGHKQIESTQAERLYIKQLVMLLNIEYSHSHLQRRQTV